MTEISKKFDKIDDTSSASNTRSCLLFHHDCRIDPEFKETSFKEHFLTEHHQKSVITIIQKAIEKKKSNSKVDNNLEQINLCYESISLSTQSIETLNDKLIQISTEALHLSNHISTLTDDLNDTVTASLIQKVHIDGMLINENVLSQDILAVKQQIECENQVTKQQILDGTMVWKISNVQEKMYDAQSERQTSIYSPAFYTSATGYKLCVRLYLNGDGTERGMYLSIFLVILRGEYDALLHWPFSYRVSFCLFDQRTMIASNGARQPEHIIQSFRPDTTSISFERPRSEMNIASGIPKFFPLADVNQSSEINRYIFNDTIFIKVLIDFIGVSKSMLPFIFSLNIAFPRLIQEKLIDEELKRRDEQNIN